jgi:predicted dehydrogenase
MRIALIGTGKIAARHVAALAGGGHQLLHLGTSPEKAAAAARQHGGIGCDSLDALLRDGRPDAVIVTVPPARHGALERRLIADKIPFLVEKPLSADSWTAEEIADRLAGSGLVVAVGYNWRGHEGLAAARAALVRAPARLVIGEFHVGLPASPWWRRRGESGGQFVEQACHVVDLARHLVGEAAPVAALGAGAERGDVTDADIAAASAALVRFRSGAVGVFSATSLTPEPRSVGLRLVGDGQQIEIAPTAVTVWTADGTAIHPARPDASYRAQNAAFLTAVAANDPKAVLCTYTDALATHRLCQAIAARAEPASDGRPAITG